MHHKKPPRKSSDRVYKKKSEEWKKINKSKGLTGKQKNLPEGLKKKIMAAKKK